MASINGMTQQPGFAAVYHIGMRRREMHAARLQWLEHAAHSMDEAFRVPGTSFRVGWDFLVGLVPVVGDMVSLIVSLFVIQEAVKLRIPRRTIIRMILNVTIDFLLGLVPIIGDLFDATWKAHRRNMHLIYEYIPDTGVKMNLASGEHRGK